MFFEVKFYGELQLVEEHGDILHDCPYAVCLYQALLFLIAGGSKLPQSTLKRGALSLQTNLLK